MIKETMFGATGCWRRTQSIRMPRSPKTRMISETRRKGNEFTARLSGFLVLVGPAFSRQWRKS